MAAFEVTTEEQRNNLTRLIVKGCLLVRFPAVTVKTSKRQILKRILTAFRYRRQMINGETNALPAFVGVTRLAQGISTFADLLSTDSRKLTRL